jgi:hypothetical protein
MQRVEEENPPGGSRAGFSLVGSFRGGEASAEVNDDCAATFRPVKAEITVEESASGQTATGLPT